MTRITSEYVPGKNGGNEGYSEIFHGIRISKGTPYIDIYNKTENLIYVLSLFLESEYKDIEEEDIKFLTWLRNSLFSINSFAYGLGLKDWCDKHIPPKEASEFLLRRINTIKTNKGDMKKEFIIYSTLLNLVRIKIRELEASFWALRDYVFENIRLNSESFKNSAKERFEKLGGFLNLLSYYVYWLEVTKSYPEWDVNNMSNFYLKDM
jgi:hypothetical protein